MPRMRKFILTAIILISSVLIFLPLNTIHAAPLYDMPVTVTQPDGTSLQLFASGDDFYNWLHDKAGYTVLHDTATGFYVYADLVDGRLVPTSLVPGHADPKAAGLVPGLNISLAEVDALRAAQMDEISAQTEQVSPAPSSGTLTNLVIFIRFDGEAEFTNSLSFFNGFLNNSTPGANSLRNYFYDVSYNTLTIDSTYFPTPGASVISYRDSHPRSYFQPYDATNPGGYMPNQRIDREQALMRDAIAYVNTLGQFPAGTIIDADNDGKVDGVTAVIKGAGGGYAELLWPHSSVLTNYTVNINGKTVTNYTLQLADWMVTSVLSHDFFHVLGAPDLYHFTFDTIHPVGGWDLMETNSNPPQHMGCYMKYKYGHWIASLPQITTPGTYTLNPVTSATNNCYKIASPNSPTEFFIVEYRRQASSTYEAGLPGSGLLVYRINPAMTGNLDGPPDEVYIFRPGGTPSQDGTINNAFFNSTVGRTAINNTTNPYTFLSNGSVGGLILCNIGAAGTTISFNYGNCGGLQVNPATWDFGNVNPGSTSSAKSFTVTNPGPGSVTTTTLTVSSQFNLTSNTCNNKTLAVNGTCTFSATFSPTAPGLMTGTVTIPSNSPFSPTTVALSGTGNGAVASVSPTSWNFGDQTVSYPSAAKSFTLTNTGAANMVVGTLTVSGDFSLVNNNCSGQTVLPAANCTFGVVFTPTTTGTRNGSVTIPSNAFNSPTTVTLSGNGTNIPGPFNKTSPANGASGQSTTVSLTWTASTGVLVYEYCVDNSNDNACNDWFGNGTSTTKVLTNLYPNTTYYWQVRSVNANGIVYANGSSTAMWSFSTTPAAPGAFNKSAPANGTTGLSTSPNLSWNPSTDATSYEYCYDTSNDNACSNWVSNGTSTTKALSGLSESTTYYWHVRAVNSGGTTYSDGSATAFWSFTTLVTAPGAFSKTSPTNGATGQSTSPTLAWGASTGATSYEYCYDTTNDNACSAWTNTGTSTSTVLSGLGEGTTYYWHVRANNSAGTTYANASATAFWAFTTGVTPPAGFGKSAPLNGASGVSSSPTLSWTASTGATSYEYCYDTTDNNACSGWASNGTSTSRTLIGLNDGTTYYWHVRALNAGGTTYSDGTSTAYWSFTVQVTPPAAFNKSSPANGATGQSTSPTITWAASTGAASYDTCYDTTNDNACSNWTSNGAATSKALNGLSEGTTYYWHVRAINAGGTTYSDGSATAFWSFTTLVTPPGTFGKSGPASGATGQPTSLILTWGTSTGAVSYEYCYDTTNDSLCSAWTGNGTSTSKSLSGLSEGTTYYWHVRAVNAGGTTYSNGSATAFWAFTTLVTPPGAFSKSTPANGATGQATNLTLTWAASTGAGSYEYCYDTSNDNSCASWSNNGTSTSKALSGLNEGTTYYWHVRAINTGGTTYANGSATAFWSFTTGVALPGAFGKTFPANTATNVSTSPTLSWVGSTGATSYDYCYDTTNDNACSTWISNGSATTKALSGLSEGTTYYWHVRANNTGGTTFSDGSATAFWSFSTMLSIPGPFGKTSPANGATGQATSPTLSWAASTGAASYEYCLDTINNNSCDTSWASNGNNTSVAISGLNPGTYYFWHVRAINATGTTYSNSSTTAFWWFTTLVTPPGAFNKSSPADAATGVSTSPTLSWAASTGAASYEYCYDTSNDNACSSWTSNGTATSKILSGLSGGSTYYWHVRAINSAGTTYANGSATAFWSFTTAVALPGSFSKSAPINGATNQTTSPTIAWGASAGATSYDYCYDTTNDNTCSAWTGNGSTTSKALSGLSEGTTYYWHVRANNSGGTTYAEGSATAFWSFTTQVTPPGAFNKSSPADAATGVSTSPTLSWAASTGATSYEYCYDTTNDNACSSWTSNGSATSKALSGLSGGSTYYWHVRAINSAGTTYANGSATAFWSFTTAVAMPGSFSKSAPINGAINQTTSPTIAWGASAGATSYDYCYDTTNDNACSGWTGNGSATSKALSGLSEGTTYYWHVRATNTGGTTYSDGSTTAFWSFTTQVTPPGTFNKTAPANGATDLPTSITLTWSASAGSTSYEYCYDTTNNNNCSGWTSNGTSTSKSISGLDEGTTYYWHVRAINSAGTTYANGSATSFWAFSTGVSLPGAFDKTFPANGATGVSTFLTLTWSASVGATSYEYCYDTSNDNTCSAWTSNGTSTSKALSGLGVETTYYWHVRAINPGGTTYANGSATAFWTFTTDGAVPGAFNMSSPANGASGQATSLTLSWGASAGSTSYEYCYDTSNDSACSGWTSNGTATSKSISGLNKGTTYYWHVRSNNANGTTYAGGSTSAFWSFTTIAPPPADFTKSAPANGSTGQSTSLTLSWNASAGATSYEYCYDTTDNNNCSGWTGSGASTNATLSGLNEGTAYYWHVRAISEGGTTYANGSSTAFWSFTTGLSLPGAFNKTSPLNNTNGQQTSLVLTWTASSAATAYEVCYDTSNDNDCTTWTDNGNSTSISLDGLVTGEIYYWQVKAVNAGGSAFADDGAGWSFTTVPTFSDVAYTHWAWSWIERLYSAGITNGCGNSPKIYCPEQTVTRAQMAVFLERGKNGSSFVPLGATGIFDDVPTNHWAAGFIEQLYADGITTGCASSPLRYCPENPVTRDQMAVFLLRAKYGKTYTPPPATGIFNDVPTSHWAAAWIEQLLADGITTGCGGGNYCPSQVVNRAQMAAFLVRAFGLP